MCFSNTHVQMCVYACAHACIWTVMLPFWPWYRYSLLLLTNPNNSSCIWLCWHQENQTAPRSPPRCANMPLSPLAFEVIICEINIFTAGSLHIKRLQIAAPACFFYKQHQHASVHVHSAPHAARAASYMQLQSPLYKNPIHSGNQHSKVVMHILVLPHTPLTLHIWTCAGRRFDTCYELCTLCIQISHFNANAYCSEEHEVLSILNSSSCFCEVMLFHCAFAHLIALQARLLHTLVIENTKMDTMDISLPTTSNRPCSLDLKRL